MKHLSWLTVVGHAKEQIEHGRSALETATDPLIIGHIQASIRVWREVLDLPDTLSPEPTEPDRSAY